MSKWTLFPLLLAQLVVGQSDKLDRVTKFLAAFEKSDAPGMSVAITEDGKTVYSKGFGLADVDHKNANSAKTVFNAGSIAKQFTASCIWIFVSQNKISLDDDIRKYLPEMPIATRPILIANLLDHSSGIRNYHTLMDLQGFDYETEYYNNKTVLELASRQKPPSDAQRRKTSYSNTNYNLLALIVERVSRQDLNAFATQHLFAPLGMKTTEFRVSNKQKFPNRAFGYSSSDAGFSVVPDVVQESYGAGNLWTCTDDLAKWTQVLTGNATDYASLREFLTQCDQHSKYARGVLVDSFKGHKTVGHSGSEFGWKSYLVTVPDEKIGVVVLCNSENQNPSAVAISILDILLDNNSALTSNELKSEAKIDTQFLGRYLETNSDMQMEIFIENDTLKSRVLPAKKGVALLAEDPRHFYRKNNKSVKYEFRDSDDCDMIVSFSGNPFYFSKMTSDAAKNVDITVFEGEYFSEELQTSYRFYAADGKLYLSFKNNPKIALNFVQNVAFGNGRRTIYRFERNSKNQVSAMKLSSEGSVSDILFVKRS